MKNERTRKIDSCIALKSILVFADLDDEACANIAKIIKWKQYRKGAEIVSHQTTNNEVYFIASGCVRVTIFAQSGKEISYQELGTGEMFGELAAIDGMPRAASVITGEPSQIGSVSASEYWKLVNQYPGVAAASLKHLVNMIRFLVDRVYQYGAFDVKDRIRMEILRLARENMTDDDRATIQDFPTHREIANRVMTHREAVTRGLNELTRMGLIEQDHRTLVVDSIVKLRNLVFVDLQPDTVAAADN